MTTIEKATSNWPYDQMRDNYYYNARDVWVEVDEAFYWQALEVMPPIYVRAGFMVSEPMCHTSKDDPVYSGFVRHGDRFFACDATREDFATKQHDLYRTLLGTAE